jgi:hypothetical protein
MLSYALKALIGAACVAALTYVGYFFLSQYRATTDAYAGQIAASQRQDCLHAMRSLNRGAYAVRPTVDRCIAEGTATLEDELAAEQANK